MPPGAMVVDRRLVGATIEADPSELEGASDVDLELIAHPAEIEVLDNKMATRGDRDRGRRLRTAEAIIDLARHDIDRAAVDINPPAVRPLDAQTPAIDVVARLSEDHGGRFRWIIPS